MYFKKLIHPEYFQGNKKKDHYFEGWYYKLVSRDEKDTIAFIPGVSINQKDQHAFIQVFISHKSIKDVSLKTHYIRFDFNDFSYSHKEFWIRIGKNYFSKERIELSIRKKDLKISGIVNLDILTPIKTSLFSPNIMGIFGYVNFMECYHGIISMSHQLSGIIPINQKNIDFFDGKGYMEKDWGTSFPKTYVWLQSNHFKDSNTSFLFSYADIPFIGFHFKGLIVNLFYQNKEYRFATYNGAKVKKEEIGEGNASYTIKKGKYRLEVVANSSVQIELASPKNGMMIEQIKEGLSGNIHLKLYDKNNLIYEDIGEHAGIEIMKPTIK